MEIATKHIWVTAAASIFLLHISAMAQTTTPLKPGAPQIDSQAVGKDNHARTPLKGSIQRNTHSLNNKLNGELGRSQPYGHNRQTPQGIFSERVQSSIGIIGVRFLLFRGHYPIIKRVFPNTPASVAGVLTNDAIVAVDGIPTIGLSKDEIYDLIVGTPGTPVTMSLERMGKYRVSTMTRMDLNDISDPFVRADYLRSM